MGCFLEIQEVTTVDLRNKSIWNNHRCRNKVSKGQETLKPENQTRHRTLCYCNSSHLSSITVPCKGRQCRHGLPCSWEHSSKPGKYRTGERKKYKWRERGGGVVQIVIWHRGKAAVREQMFWSLSVLIVCSKDEEVWLLLQWDSLMAYLTSVKLNKYQMSSYYNSFPLCSSIPAKGWIQIK